MGTEFSQSEESLLNLAKFKPIMADIFWFSLY